ncbi:Netrin-4 Beta-netrin [Triplophysa tibetana]|uniref:Netrin-4 Beta-netrin n=1 Tax=Triplophysa tibetana TaxID=1572043 RepID=A0A5A9NGI4_9TELE|nr:Netrin-4 Beta-netrin [Triplophysa tibetana]
MKPVRQRVWFVMLILNCELFLFPGLLQGFKESRCVEYACSPPMGNLASGRTLFTLFNSSCLPTHPRCVTDLHPPSMMSDDPLLHPDTWWASAVASGEKDEIRLDLEKRFCLTHVVLSFRSPRPAAMMLERSQDFGQSWETLKLFARNCSEMFGVPDDVSQAGALCTSRYSNVVPCSRGEIIFRSIGLGSEIADPYSPEAVSRLTLTNLRIQLLKSQQCPPSKGRRSILDPSKASFLPTVHSRCLACACVPTTQLVSTARGVSRSTMTDLGGRPTEAVARATRARNVSVMAMQRAATSRSECGCPQGAVVGASVIVASITLWAAGASAVVLDTTATLPDPSTRPMHAHDAGVTQLALCQRAARRHGAIPEVGSATVNLVWVVPPAVIVSRGTGALERKAANRGNVKLYNVPIGGKIPELSHFKPQEDERAWPKELAHSALYFTVIKASVLTAHDKGTHAVVQVKVRKVFRSGKLPLLQGTHSLYPLSWISRGCTCPILNPGESYLLAGPEELNTGRLLVTMQSLVVPWTPTLGFQVTEALHQGCL